MSLIKLHYTLKLNDPWTVVWLCMFSPALCGRAYYKFQVGRRERNVAELTVTSKQPRLSSPIYCWVYKTLPQGKQRYMTRIGFAEMNLGDAEQGKVKAVVDITGISVGTLQFELRSGQDTNAADVESGFEIYDDSDAPLQQYTISDKQLEDLSAQTDKQLSAAPWGDRTNITSALPHFIFRNVQQHCGVIPMWAFTTLNLETEATPDEAYFKQVLYNAKYLLMTPTVDFQNRPEVAELLNEIQTLPVRAQLYVLDRSGDRFVDDWLNPLLCPSQSQVGLDCEDAVQRMLQEGYWLGNMAATDNKELNQLIEVEKNNYITFLAAMTLKLPNGSWVYHAAGLKLDRDWVLQRLGLQKPTAKPAKGWWPAVLLEGTAYTTGCWTYESTIGAQKADRIAQSSQLQFTGGVDAICKVTPRIMAQKDLYGPIQSLFSHELARDYGLVQIELGENDRRGARPQSIVAYDNKVEWVPIKLDKRAVQKQLMELKQAAFPVPPIPLALKNANRPPIRPREQARYDFCVREVDWFDFDIRAELQNSIGKSRDLHVTRLNLAADLDLVHVTV